MKSCFTPLFEEEVNGKKLKEYPDYFIEQYIEYADTLLIAQEKKPKELINEDIIENGDLLEYYNERRDTTLAKTK
jgi:hypothetical protein